MKMKGNKTKWKVSMAVVLAAATLSGQVIPVMATETADSNALAVESTTEVSEDTLEIGNMAEEEQELLEEYPEPVMKTQEEPAETTDDDGFVKPMCGYRPVEEADPVSSVTKDGDYDGGRQAALEPRYNPLDAGFDSLPAVRDQSPYGTCWTFAAMASGEIGAARRGITKDLSELHLAYFAYHTVNDPLGGLEGDYNSLVGSDFMNGGGNNHFSSIILSNWTGAADEATVPYSKAADALANGLDTGLAYNDSMHLQGAYFVDLIEDQDLAKEYIKKLGAIGIAYGDYDEPSWQNNNYFNVKNSAYYCDKEYVANHEVAVIGWDDNFSADNFTLKPEGDGAWLVRNSWGGTGYGRMGYFWLSYYDATLTDRLGRATACAFEYEDADNYAHNYQYDGGMLTDAISLKGSNTIQAANIFVPQTGNGKCDIVKAVSFYSAEPNTDYRVEIYTELKNPADPTSGILAEEAVVTGKTTAEGYYTVKLPRGVAAQKGEPFSVVVKLYKSAAAPAIGIEYGYSASWYKSITSAEAGQSLVGLNGEWYDWGAEEGGNLRIKAFTDEGYSDVPAVDGNWKHESVKFVSERGLMGNITGTDQFMPDNQLSRGMFVTVLYRLEGQPAVAWESKFTDVIKDKWYSNAVLWASGEGIVNGFADKSFGVNTNITREQIAKMLYGYAKSCGYDVSQKASLNSFTDKAEVSGWAVEYMEWATATGLISGKPNGNGSYKLDPKGDATRAECAAMLMRFANKYGN